MEKKLKINMLSKADSVDGQGVGSAYLEQVALVKEATDLFDITVNKRGKKFDIYHIHSVNPGYYFKLRRYKKKLFVCYVHFLPDTLDGSIKLPKLFLKIFKKYVLSMYRRSDEIVVVNPIFIQPLIDLGIDKNHITYIPNYVNKDDFHKLDSEEIDKVKDEYKLKKNKFTVLGVGQVQHRKGVLDFVEVAKKNPDMEFVWAGGFSFGKITDGYKELSQVVENHPDNVTFLGIVPRTEMNKLYNACDCLFMPSYNELFPMSILEAINSAKPVLLRDLDLYKDILFNRYVIGTNNDEFAEALNKLASDKEYYLKESENSKYLSEYYSKEHVLEIWKEYYVRIYDDFYNKGINKRKKKKFKVKKEKKNKDEQK